MECEIIRKRGIDTLVSGYVPQKVEEEKKTTIIAGKDYHNLLARYEHFLGEVQYWGPYDLFQEAMDETEEIEDILKPNEINSLLQLTYLYEEHDDFWMTGHFMWRLFDNSIRAGYMNFTVKAHPEISSFCGHLRGTAEEPLLINVKGKTGGGLCSCCRNVICRLDGDAGDYVGEFSRDSEFTINGDIGINCGYRSINCSFKTGNKETLQKMLLSAPRKSSVWYVEDGIAKRKRRFKEFIP